MPRLPLHDLPGNADSFATRQIRALLEASLKEIDMPATQAQVISSIASDRERAAEDASLGDTCECIIREAYERCAELLKSCENDRAYKLLELLEEAKGEAGAMHRENAA